MDRLQHALELFLAWNEDPAREPREAFLARHPDQRELLELVLEAGTAEPEPLPSEPSRRRIGDFEVVREIGRGGMGVVYEAAQISLDRHVALKVLPGGLHLHPAALTRFKREAQTVARLHHPGIVKVHAVGGDPDQGYWFAMELLDGESLDKLVARTSRTASRSREHLVRMVGIAVQVADALHYAHCAGVLHRDVKPSNVILCRDDRAVLTDFGLAREEALPSVTLSGQVAGTPCYMAPEQTGGSRGQIDERADVYGLGATLYELLTLRKAFDGDTAHEVLRQVLERDVPDARRANPTIPRDLAAILGRTMAKERERRYPSAAALADDLRAWLTGRPVTARLAGPTDRLLRWLRREPALALLTGGLVLALLLGIGASLVFAGRADAAADRANDALAHLLRFADVQRVADLRSEEQRLWPPIPELLPALDGWLSRADELEGRRPAHEQALRALEASGDTSAEVAWQRQTQRHLLDELTILAGLRRSVAERRAMATTIETNTLIGGEAARSWADAAKDVAHDPRFAGLQLRPHLGLLPLGKDPVSGLWEFWHVQSGERPERGADGRIQAGPDAGMVLVLLPGGKVTLGCRKPTEDDPPGTPFTDPATGEFEMLYEVELQPFFLAKHELTQSQWLRLFGTQTAYFNPVSSGPKDRPNDPALPHNPVEFIDWHQAKEAARRAGLALPTEAQWEHACRAGTTSPYWTGDSVLSLQGAANIADRARRKALREYEPFEEVIDDGRSIHAPVGSYAANPFGLHDMHGNVREWCEDWAQVYLIPPRSGDGLRNDPREQRFKVVRGGSYADTAVRQRSAYRAWEPTLARFATIGVRLARSVDR